MSIMIVLFYFGVAWYLVGRDPKKNALPHTDKLPEGFCPAAAHYLWTLGDIKFSVAAALLSMAVKGYLIVEEPESVCFVCDIRAKGTRFSLLPNKPWRNSFFPMKEHLFS